MGRDWIFFGRVLPERIPLSAEVPNSEAAIEDLGLKLRITIKCWASQIVARVSVLEGTADLATLRNILSDHVHSFIDLIGFKQGQHFDVEIVAAADCGSDEWAVFGTVVPTIAFHQGMEPASGTLDGNMFGKVSTDQSAGLALADFRRAMRDAVGTGFFCYRAIESIKRGFGTGDDAHAWERMRRDLRVKRDAIDYVKAHADTRRHGGARSVTDDDRGRLFRITKDIIDRYINYLLGDKRPLNPERYPELFWSEI